MPLVFQEYGDVDRVRDASDIVSVIGEYVRLRDDGAMHVGLCPFHRGDKPTLVVIPGKRAFVCYGCGLGGDVFSFMQRFHRVGFTDALGLLARRAGITLSSAGE